VRASALLFFLIACGSSQVAETPREPAPPFRHGDAYAALEADAEGFSFHDGDWLEDYGDAPFYGLAYYARKGNARAEPARRRALATLEKADFFKDDLQELVTSTLGLIDRIESTGDRSDAEKIEAFVDRLDRLVALLGWYIEGAEDRSWALATYGPTSIAALVGLTNAQYALIAGSETRRDWAVEMAKKIEERAWQGSYYKFSSTEGRLDLYPNVAMILFHARLFQLTKDEHHRARARALYQAIQPLKVATSPTRYYSEYSARAMGATTRDYSTLSSQNYVVLALLVLYEITGKAVFVEEADQVLDAMTTQLRGKWCLSHVHENTCGCAEACVAGACTSDRCGGGILHHWIDGRSALPTDPEYFCSGCNLQILYVMQYRARTGAGP
jgi:hypothetical protein